jgi:signal peptidase II
VSLNEMRNTTMTQVASATPSDRQRRRVLGLFGSVIAAVMLVDQASKHWSVNELKPGQERALLPFLKLVHARNTGVAFNKGTGMAGIIVPILLVVGLIAWTARNEFRQPGGPHRWAPLAYGLILGGAFGNLIDRIFRGPGWGKGAVIDMIDVSFWPVFNVADAALSVGVVITLLTLLRGKRQTETGINS